MLSRKRGDQVAEVIAIVLIPVLMFWNRLFRFNDEFPEIVSERETSLLDCCAQAVPPISGTNNVSPLGQSIPSCAHQISKHVAHCVLPL